MVQNPNWPLIVAELNPTGNPNYGTGYNGTYTDLVKRLVKNWRTTRGRQFELDAVRPGTFNGVWENRDGALDPSNTAGLLYPDLLPYRPWQLRAQWPATINRLTADQATGGEGTPLAPGTNGLFSAYGIPVAVAASASAWQGSQVWQASFNANTAYSVNIDAIRMPASIQPVAGGPGMPYSFSTQLRCATAGAAPTVQLFIRFFDINSNTLAVATSAPTVLTGGTAAAWTPLVASGIAPAGAWNVNIGVSVVSGPTTAWALQMDGAQFEQNLNPSPFTVPGTWYPMYTGMIERYPQSWDQAGSFGMVSPVGVDTLALLSQITFPDLMTAAVNAPRSPTGIGLDFCYRLGEPSGSTSFADATGQRQNAVASPAGGVTAGVAQTSVDPGGGYAAAPSTTVVNLNPSSPGSYTYQPWPAVLLPQGPNGLYGPPMTGGFTRLIAFRPTAGTGTNGESAIWSADTALGSYVAVRMLNGNNLQWACYDNGSGGGAVSLGTVVIGDWNLVIASSDAAGNGYLGCVNGRVGGLGWATPWRPTDAFEADTIGADAATGLTEEFAPFAGDVAWFCQWPFQLSGAQMYAIWQNWANGGAGDSTGQRYSRILALAGYQGPAIVDPGRTTGLPAATDIAGQDALTALTQVAATENGQSFVDASGVIRFQDRSRRAQAATPQFTFGENTAAGEYPYDKVEFDFDPTRIGNDIQITQQPSNRVYRAFDAMSQAAYGIRTVTRTTQATSPLEINDAAYFLLKRYAKARMRIKALTLNPGANPALWPVCLALELGTRIKVMRRPPGASPIAFDGFVEAITWNLDDGENATVDLEVSPADSWTAWTGAAMHFTYAGNIVAGSAWYQFTGALTDSAGNPVHSDLSIGQQLLLGAGTTAAQTVTITGIDGNGAGTVQFNAATATAGPVTISDVLPSGVTDPTKYDAMAVLGKTTTLGY